MPSVKAVLFDLYDTLVHHHPLREDIQAQACSQAGLKVTPEAVRQAFPTADEFYHRENSRSPIEKRPPEEKMAAYARYQAILLKAMGIETSPQVIRDILMRLRAVEMKLVLFDDVLPTLKELKGRGLTLGLISNIDRDIKPLCTELGLSQCLDFWVTAREMGMDKPDPRIYKEALHRAGVEAAEALYVADRYQDDISGALELGIRSLLLDRAGLFTGFAACPRIERLPQVMGFI